MGEAILASLLRSGYKASEITVIEKRAERLLELTEKYQVKGDGIEGKIGRASCRERVCQYV